MTAPSSVHRFPRRRAKSAADRLGTAMAFAESVADTKSKKIRSGFDYRKPDFELANAPGVKRLLEIFRTKTIDNV
jgi:hypothetical protein